MLTIHQAIFGDKAEGYGLLKATCSIDLAKRIANATDIHEQTPDGITWSYSLRGFAWEEEHFLLMRTFVDKSPNVRQGRVYTHCLIIPATGLKQIDNLDSLLNYLPVDLEKEASIAPIDFKIEEKIFKKPTSRTNCLIKNLAIGNIDLFAWIGYDDYEQALTVIWANVSAAIRLNLRFGIAFSPTDSKGRPGIKILTVPSQLVTRWRADDIGIISSNDQCVLHSDAEKILAGDTEGNNLFEFIKDAAISVNKISDYSHIQTIYKTASNLQKADLNSLLTLLNTLTVYNSQSEHLKKLNQDTGNQIIDCLKRGNLKEIIRVRNEDLKHLINPKLEKEVGLIIEKKLAELKDPNFAELKELIAQLIKPNIKDWWRTATKVGLVTLFNKQFNHISGLILQLIESGESQIVELLDNIVLSSSNQTTLINKINAQWAFTNYSTLKIWAAKRHWFQLHALCLTQTVSVLQAIEEQLKIDPSYEDEDAFNFIVNFYDFDNSFQAGQSLDLDFITRLIASLCIKRKKNSEALEIELPYSQLVILSMIDQGWGFWSDVVQSKKRITGLLNLIVEGGNVNNRLLNLIFQNPVTADIYNFPRRRELWSKLSEPLKTKLLKNAALFYMAAENLSNFSDLESDLQFAIKNINTINEFVEANSESMAKVLPVFETLIIHESYVQDYIRYYNRPLTLTESVLLGQLVTRKNWKNCAKEIYNKSDYNISFKEALAECHQLLSIYDRLSLSLSGSLKYHSISDAEWWLALKEIAIDLFPEGPRQQKIWEEAGGKTHDLDLSGNGREQWNYAISSLRNGVSGIKSKNLVNAMLKEYSNNPHLKLLKSWLKQD